MFDIAIIGGGPAGLTAGISLAQSGFKTILIEKKSFPVDKPCGEGIMPTGLAILKKLGVFEKIPEKQCLFFEGIHSITSHQQLQANFLEGPGLAVRRPILSQALLDIASTVHGLSILDKTPVLEIKASETDMRLRTPVHQIRTRFLIGADGLNSPTRHWLGFKASLGSRKRYGTTQRYHLKPWNNKVEIHWKMGLEAYITPNGPDSINLAFLWDKNQYNPHFLSEFPELQERLENAPKIGLTGSRGPFYHIVKNPIAPQTALIGDAAGYLDPITGEGISLGLQSALLLSQCLTQNKPLSWYAHELRKSRHRYIFTTRSLLFLAQHERLFNLSLSFLKQHPKIFQHLLSLNMGSII